MTEPTELKARYSPPNVNYWGDRCCKAEARIAELEAENVRLRALLSDKNYLRCKADYSRGHLSHANYLESKEKGLGLGE